MFPYAFYKVVHVLGIAFALVALGGFAAHALNGGEKQTNVARRLMIGMHGVGSLFVLVGGFGLLARLNFQHGTNFPLWLWGKIGIWALLTLLVVLPYRARGTARPMLIALPLLAMSAAMMAVYKPF